MAVKKVNFFKKAKRNSGANEMSSPTEEALRKSKSDEVLQA